MVPVGKVAGCRALVIVIAEYSALANCSIVYFRSTKRPVRYIEAEVLSDEDGSDTEVVSQDTSNETNKVTVPSPIKKPKVSNNLEEKATLIEDKESTDVKERELQESSKTKKTKKEAKTKRASKKKKGKKGEATRCLLKILFIIGMFHTSTKMLYWIKTLYMSYTYLN